MLAGSLPPSISCYYSGFGDIFCGCLLCFFFFFWLWLWIDFDGLWWAEFGMLQRLWADFGGCGYSGGGRWFG